MSAPLVVNVVGGAVWTRREATRDGLALYAPEKCGTCPESVMATYAELEARGIAGSADALPMPAGPAPEGREAAKARVRAKAEAHKAMPARERIYHLLCATYTHAEAEAMLAEVDGRHELDRLSARVAELEAERHSTNESLSAAAERMRADRDRITDLEESPLAWADELDSKSLDNFLIALAAATEYEPLSGAVDEIHQLVRSFREAAQAQDEREPDVDGAGRTYESYYPERSVKASVFVPVASLREPEGEHYPLVHHDYRVSHDLPETGGQR